MGNPFASRTKSQCPFCRMMRRAIRNAVIGMSASAVLLAAIAAVVIGLCVLGPPLWMRLQG